MRILILCTHNSARSQMAEGWTRFFTQQHGLEAEVWSAGTEATLVKENAVKVMAEADVDISGHASKTLYDLPDPWNFDLVVTVCDSAAEACPVYPAKTTMRHYPFVDPSGPDLEKWRTVRDQMKGTFEALVKALSHGQDAPPDYLESPSVGV